MKTPLLIMTAVPLIAFNTTFAAPADSLNCKKCVKSSHIKNRAITTRKIRNASVTEAKLAPAVVSRLTALEEKISQLQSKLVSISAQLVNTEALQYLSVGEFTDPLSGISSPMLYLKGVNLQVSSNGVVNTGNIFIGSRDSAGISTCSSSKYTNESDCLANNRAWGFHQTGEHNFVLGNGAFFGSNNIVGNGSFAANNSMAFGQQNKAYSNSVVIGGSNNSSYAAWGAILGGNNNIATRSAYWGTVVGGDKNQVSASSYYATAAGGHGNKAGGDTSSTFGGMLNTSTGAKAATIGGYQTNAQGNLSTITGGRRTQATEVYQVAP